ncbi:MFS transporter [Agaricicola taiwanensis]|uniref:MFS transporter n=2 Tax=Agaricicola taiwanensis TaxID=591372 RepID=A0A8J2VUN1_9RHOB|nr:MFS transporter [Agaricicola taiwanensis]
MVAAYMGASTLLGLTQGMAMNLVTVNIPQISGAIGATTTETTWLVAAYMAPNVSMAIALIKIRAQYGLRNFAELSILGFVIVAILNLFINDLQSALVVRFVSGIAAAPMSTLAFLYMLEPFPSQKKFTIGLSLVLTNTALGPILARLISPALLDIGHWHGLMVLELGTALMAFGAVYMLPLTPQPRAKVISTLDVTSYLLIAIGFGCTAVTLVLGRLYWWFEAPWLGVLLAVAISCVTAAVVIELNREQPLIDIRWLTSPAMLHFAAALLIFRVVLSEQTTGAAGLFQQLGLLNEQMHSLYLVIMAATIAGGLTCAAVLRPGREPYIHVVALLMIATGAFMDSHATSLTRPQDMYLSQALIAFGGVLFLPPALASGLMSALKKGPNYILSFIVIFLSTQSLGGLLGSAVFGTFITWREKFHSNMLVEHLVLTQPHVAQRVAQLGQTYGRVLTDKTLLNAEGLALLSQQATREANVLAYNDAFLLIGAIAAISLATLLGHIAINALRDRRAPGTAAAA